MAASPLIWLQSYLVTIVIIGAITASTTFIYFTLWKSVASRRIRQINNAHTLSVESLNSINGFIAAASFDIHEWKPMQLYVWGKFIVVVGLNRLDLYEAYKNSEESISFRFNRKSLAENATRELFLSSLGFQNYIHYKNYIQRYIPVLFQSLLSNLEQRGPEIIKELRDRKLRDSKG